MSARNFSRLAPAVAVAALLALAAAAPNKRPAGPTMPAPPVSAPCPEYSHTGGGDSAITFANGDGVLQPLPEFATAAACSLRVNGGYYSYAVTSAREWDATTLAPDPQTVALRTATINPSAFNYAKGYAMPWLSFVPPIITRSVLGVAEPPRSTVAIEVRSQSNYSESQLTARYEPEGNPDIAAASPVAAGGTHDALQGSHPVIAHALCSGDDGLQSLRIAQSVRRTDVAFSDRPVELVQRFRVPESVELRWIELALSTTPNGAPQDATAPDMPVPTPAVLAVVDPEGASVPPETIPPAIIEAVFAPEPFPAYSTYSPSPRWSSHLDFDRTFVLLPDHDYWLYLRSAASYTFLGRALTGSEGPDFTAGVGELFTRTAATGAWTPVTDEVLAFKIVGRPSGTTRVPPQNAAFLVRVAPNPARDVAAVAWSGAVGPVRLEVIDARGRRVATNDGGAAGSWRWSTLGARGEPLPAGVYFLHARDSAGGHVVQRLVIYR